MERILADIPVVVVDHHLLRDQGWYKFLDPVRKVAEKSRHDLVTASGLLQKQAEPLECKRQSLYEEEKPTKEFLEWARLPKGEQADKPPPL